jgi:serine phosphatase RsbU (regulator of sigma subunit)/pSer/pThr/pTyr-binding forkhead associated (FHA) protein
MAYLRYLDDTDRLQTKVLDAGQFLIGRASTCHLVFDSEKISREHVRIDVQGDGRYRLRDLGSRNKTFVNGELIRETLLTPGAIIRVGDRVVEFVDDEAGPQHIELDFITPDMSEPPDCEWIKTKAPLSLGLAHVERLARLVTDQPLTARAEDIADAALGELILDMEAERGLVALCGRDMADLRPLAHRALGKRLDGSMTPVSQSFLSAALLQSVAGRYPTSGSKVNTKLGYACTAVVAPLTHRGEVIGLLYLDGPSGKKPFSRNSLQYCAAAGAHVGALIGESSRRLTEAAGREGATWMSTIRRLQATLSPTIAAGDTFDAAARCHRGRMRCGDFASVIHVDDQRCGIIVIDAGGHGITGVTQAMAIRSALETALSISEDVVADPAPVFTALNRSVAASSARQVLPCLLVALDLARGKLAYINAGGMAPLFMVGAGRLVAFDETALILGVDPLYEYETGRHDLPGNFRIICYTDGLVEMANAGNEAFGAHRLQETLLEREALGSAADMVAAVSNAWQSHLGAAQPADDATVLVVGHG